jgi:hypothetical protein
LTAPEATRVLGSSTCSPINRERPVCSASSSTGTKPAADTKFRSSNTADSMLNVCDDCTGNAFRNRDAYAFDNRYCPSSGGIFAVHTPIIADRPSTDSGLAEQLLAQDKEQGAERARMGCFTSSRRMCSRPRWTRRWPNTSAMTNTIRQAVAAATHGQLTLRLRQQLGIAPHQLKEEAEAVRVVRHDQEVERPRKLHLLPLEAVSSSPRASR